MLSLRVKQRSKLWKMLKEQGKNYISSTELAAVFHASVYGSRKKLFHDKSNKRVKRFPSSLAQEHGNKWEPVAIKVACAQLDQALEKKHTWMQPGIIRDPWSVLGCSPDQICEDFGLEIKCPWKRKLPETKYDIIPDNLLQCFACIHISKLPHWYLWYFDAYTARSVVYHIEANQKLWDEEISPKARDFLELVEIGDLKEGLRVKRKEDKILWEALRMKLLEGVERVL